MRLWISLLSFSLCQFQAVLAQNSNYGNLKDGDIIFQDLDCGPLCDAIEQVTYSYGGRHFSHLGLVSCERDSIFVIEAIGTKVQKTTIDKFLARTNNEHLIGRLKRRFLKLAKTSTLLAKEKIGMPYDDAFLYNNGKYYCSELIYDVFKQANNNNSFFELAPMTFKMPNSESFFPVWVEYYKNLGLPIPESKLGINPGGISRSKKLKVYKFK
jgi:hypothetical protein